MTVSEKIKHALEIDGVAILPPMDVFESIAVLKDAILNNEEWESLCIEHIQLAQFVDLISKVQDHKAHLNDRRVKLIMASMITFYLSVGSIIISFAIAIILIL